MGECFGFQKVWFWVLFSVLGGFKGIFKSFLESLMTPMIPIKIRVMRNCTVSCCPTARRSTPSSTRRSCHPGSPSTGTTAPFSTRAANTHSHTADLGQVILLKDTNKMFEHFFNNVNLIILYLYSIKQMQAA